GCTSGIAEMLMQSADGAVHLLPALPDEWPAGRIKGLRALGGFEIEELTWKDGVVERVVIRSNLGGNLRRRSPNLLISTSDKKLIEASGPNLNHFYDVAETPNPIINTATEINAPSLRRVTGYDFPTQPGMTYVFVATKSTRRKSRLMKSRMPSSSS